MLYWLRMHTAFVKRLSKHSFLNILCYLLIYMSTCEFLRTLGKCEKHSSMPHAFLILCTFWFSWKFIHVNYTSTLTTHLSLSTISFNKLLFPNLLYVAVWYWWLHRWSSWLVVKWRHLISYNHQQKKICRRGRR